MGMSDLWDHFGIVLRGPRRNHLQCTLQQCTHHVDQVAELSMRGHPQRLALFRTDTNLQQTWKHLAVVALTYVLQSLLQCLVQAKQRRRNIVSAHLDFVSCLFKLPHEGRRVHPALAFPKSWAGQSRQFQLDQRRSMLAVRIGQRIAVLVAAEERTHPTVGEILADPLRRLRRDTAVLQDSEKWQELLIVQPHECLEIGPTLTLPGWRHNAAIALRRRHRVIL
mmetsp:Transcript_28607/g.71937  ORF Transcript_28607/g.71937 Transcript_28607/m.71937 type:complete len:223 (+) Transcript_28607:709-1377(+)